MTTNRYSPVLQSNSKLTVSRSRAAGERKQSKVKVVHERLDNQKDKLIENLQKIFDSRNNQKLFGECYILLRVTMFNDSLATSYTPNHLFSNRNSCNLVAPMKNGYLVETNIEKIPTLIAKLNQKSLSFVAQSDISRVESINVFSAQDVIRGQSVEDIWKCAHTGEKGRLFSVLLAPFKTFKARIDLANKFAELVVNQQDYYLPDDKKLVRDSEIAVKNWNMYKELEKYKEEYTVGEGTIEISSPKAISKLVRSGTIFKIEPVGTIFTSNQNVDG